MCFSCTSDTRLNRLQIELQDTIARATLVVTKYYTERILPILDASNVPHREVWDQQRLQSNDWQGLAKNLLAMTFGHALLEPIEQTDLQFRINVKHTDLREFVNMIEKATPHDPMDKVRTVNPPTVEKVLPTRVAVDPYWIASACCPSPHSIADTISPAVERELTPKEKPALRLAALLDFSEEAELNPAPPPYARQVVPRDQVPWRKK